MKGHLGSGLDPHFRIREELARFSSRPRRHLHSLSCSFPCLNLLSTIINITVTLCNSRLHLHSTRGYVHTGLGSPLFAWLPFGAPRLPCLEFVHRPWLSTTSKASNDEFHYGLITRRHGPSEPPGFGVSLHFADLECQNKKVQAGHRARHVGWPLQPCTAKQTFRHPSSRHASCGVDDTAGRPAPCEEAKAQVESEEARCEPGF